MLLLALTTAIAGTFFGGALYVSLVDHPARVACGGEAAVKMFRPALHRAAAMMGFLSTSGSVLGLAAAWRLHDWHIATNAVLLALPIPVTFLLIAPVNHALLGGGVDPLSAQAAALFRRWGRLHGIRTVLGGLAFLLFLFRLLVHAGVLHPGA